MFRTSLFLQELKLYQANIYESCFNAWQAKTKDLDFIRIGLQEFQQCPENSIDYAIMENTAQGLLFVLMWVGMI